MPQRRVILLGSAPPQPPQLTAGDGERRMDALITVKELAAKQFGRDVSEINADAPLDQLGIDSLGYMEFLFDAEDAFGLSIPPESVEGVKTLRELADAIARLQTPSSPGAS
jgi:acyl carrier protein